MLGSTDREISYVGPTPLLVDLPIMVPCFSCVPKLLPSTLSVAMTQPPQAVSAPNPCPLPGTEVWILSFSTQPPFSLTEECLRLGSTDVVVLIFCAGYSPFTLHKLDPALYSETPKLPLPSRLISPLMTSLPKDEVTFPSSQLLLPGSGSVLIPSFSFYFYYTWLCEGFLVFLNL